MNVLLEFKKKLIQASTPTDEDLIQVQPGQLIVYFKNSLEYESKMREMQGAIGSIFLFKDDNAAILAVSEFNGHPMYTLTLKSSKADESIYADCAHISKSVGGIAEFQNVEISKIEVRLYSMSADPYILEL